jgi:hypothetical protein
VGGKKSYKNRKFFGGFMRRRTPEQKYRISLNKQQKELDDFAEHEIEYADDLLLWYKIKQQEISADEYRSVAFFKNKEFAKKPGSLTLLYEMYQRCILELPECTRETAFDLLSFRFKLYAVTLQKGGYDGKQ